MNETIDVVGAAGVSMRSNRAVTLGAALIAAAIVVALVIGALILGGRGINADFSARLEGPSASYWFGTDQLGRDMFARTVHGLNLSLWIGLAASAVSVVIASVLAVFAATCGRWADELVALLVDVAMGLPHLLLLILISFALGGGTAAVVIAVAATHWPRLTRVLRAEILQQRQAGYVIAARRMGRSWGAIGWQHFVPHLMPQLLVGFVLLFPHAILHEAALTFLGFGLEPSGPAIGMLLSESMGYLLAGKWWLGLFPGFCLLALVLCFDAIGNGLRLLLDPRQEQA